MKVCNAEAMKIIKELTRQKDTLIAKEDTMCRVSYKEGEQKTSTDYDYSKTRQEIKDLDDKIRNIKHKLAVANATIVIPEFDMTIGEGLVLLAQLNSEVAQLEALSSNVQLTRCLTANGVIEYTECVYDVKKAQNDLVELRKNVSKLQLAIDRANLNNMLEID